MEIKKIHQLYLNSKGVTTDSRKIEDVITSYSIHYTKLYEMDTKIKCNGKNMTPILKNARRMAISGKRMIFENFQDITSHKDSEMEILRVLKEKEDRIKYLESYNFV